MSDPIPPDFVKACVQPSSDAGADARIVCDCCGWEGTWRTCDWTDEGSWEEWYWREPHCPNGCDDEVCDFTLFEIEPNGEGDSEIMYRNRNEIFFYGFSKHVFDELGLDGWKAELWAGESGCVNDLKVIALDRGTVENGAWYYTKEHVLHEIAHIGETRQGSTVTHDASFFRRLGELCIKFAGYSPIDLPPSTQRRHP